MWEINVTILSTTNYQLKTVTSVSEWRVEAPKEDVRMNIQNEQAKKIPSLQRTKWVPVERGVTSVSEWRGEAQKNAKKLSSTNYQLKTVTNVSEWRGEAPKEDSEILPTINSELSTINLEKLSTQNCHER